MIPIYCSSFTRINEEKSTNWMEKHKENDLLCGHFLVVCLKGMNLCLLVIRFIFCKVFLKCKYVRNEAFSNEQKKILTKATNMECLCDTI